MLLVKDTDNAVVGQCNMCKKEFEFRTDVLEKVTNGYNLSTDFRCDSCGDIHTDIIDYKKMLSRVNKHHARKSFENEKSRASHEREMKVESSKNRCPKCGAADFITGKKGFSVGKAVAGAVVAGGIGLAGGLIGSNKVQFVCNQCGNKWSVK